jgi:hypothetical protein
MKCTLPRALRMVSVAVDIIAVTPAQIENRPRVSSASPAVIELARLVRVHVFSEMLKTSVVSTDWLGEMMVFISGARRYADPIAARTSGDSVSARIRQKSGSGS